MASAGVRFLDLISSRRGGLLHDAARGLLLAASVPYLGLITARNAYYDFWKSRARRINCPVVSIGNITVGGTGKTPIAALVTRLLLERGRKVCLLLRGYKGKTVQNAAHVDNRSIARWRVESDEAMVLKRICPDASVVIDPNRVAGARRAVAAGADVIVLDDAFQHRRIARDLDIVLVDATRPFGFGHLLPRGLLREPTRSLRRADILILTRSDEVDDSTRTLLLATLRRLSGNKPIIAARHCLAGFVDIRGRLVTDADPSAMRAVIFAGIANFESFRRGLEKLGVQVLAAYQYPDHHDYRPDEIAGLPDVALNLDANVLLTTEKDAVKLVGRWSDEGCRLLAPRLGIALDPDGEALLAHTIDAALTGR